MFFFVPQTNLCADTNGKETVGVEAKVANSGGKGMNSLQQGSKEMARELENWMKGPGVGKNSEDVPTDDFVGGAESHCSPHLWDSFKNGKLLAGQGAGEGEAEVNDGDGESSRLGGRKGRRRQSSQLMPPLWLGVFLLQSAVSQQMRSYYDVG